MPSLGLGLGLDSSSSQSLGSDSVSDLTFAPSATLSNVGAYSTLQLTATSASSLPITFSRVSGPCFVENGNLYPTDNGTALVTASTSQQTILRSITLSGISGLSSAVTKISVIYNGSGTNYNFDTESEECGLNSYSIVLNKTNSTTWTDGNATLSFDSGLNRWTFTSPDQSGYNACGAHEARVTSSNGNIIPFTGWTLISGMFDAPVINIYKQNLTLTNPPSINGFVTAGQTRSVAGVGLSSGGQAVTLPINITTSGACSRSGSTITFTTPASGAETQFSSVGFFVSDSAFYNEFSTSFGITVISSTAVGAYIALTSGSVNANGQRFLQVGTSLIADATTIGDWNATSNMLFAEIGSGNFPYKLGAVKNGSFGASGSNSLANSNVLANVNDSVIYSNTFLPADYSSRMFRDNSANAKYFIFTKVSTGLQPSSSVTLFVNGLTGQNNAFVNGTFIKKTSGANVYYLARNGTRLESPAYSGSVWRFVKDSAIVNHSSTDNSTIPVGGWPSGLAIARADSILASPATNNIPIYVSGLSFSFNGTSFTLDRVATSRNEQLSLSYFGNPASSSYVQNVTPFVSALFNTNKFLYIRSGGAEINIIDTSTFGTSTGVKGLATASSTGEVLNFESTRTLGAGVTGDLFLEIF